MTSPRWLALLLLVATAATLSAQATPVFEVASIKVNTSDQEGLYLLRPDGVEVTNYELRSLIRRVYDIPAGHWPDYLKGGSESVLSKRFDIRARSSQRMTPAEVAAAVRTLLVERFHLQMRTELKPTDVYALTVLRKDRFGPELRRSTIDCKAVSAKLRAERNVPPDVPMIAGVPSPRDARNRPVCWPDQLGSEKMPPGAVRRLGAGALRELVRSIDGFADRPIIDGTGLSGLFEWQIDFTPATAVPQDSQIQPLLTALEDQLGLRLQRRTAPLNVHVIDRLEMPTPN